jgi:hypothetical protein
LLVKVKRNSRAQLVTSKEDGDPHQQTRLSTSTVTNDDQFTADFSHLDKENQQGQQRES